MALFLFTHATCSSDIQTDPVFTVGCCGDPQVVGNSHPLVVGHEVYEVPRLLSLLFVHTGIKGQAVQLAVRLWEERGEVKATPWHTCSQHTARRVCVCVQEIPLNALLTTWAEKHTPGLDNRTNDAWTSKQSLSCGMRIWKTRKSLQRKISWLPAGIVGGLSTLLTMLCSTWHTHAHKPVLLPTVDQSEQVHTK